MAQTLAQLVRKNEQQILEQWIGNQLSAITLRADLMKENELREQSRSFLKAFTEALQTNAQDIGAEAWKPVKEMLGEVSRSRALQGFNPTETATFVFSLKQPLFTALKNEAMPAQEFADQIWQVNI